MTGQTGLDTYTDATDEHDELVWMLEKPDGDYVPRPPVESKAKAHELREKYREQGVEDVGVVRVARSAVEKVIER